MTIESFLTRELDIRFIDARNIATEAKINLGFHGYPTELQMQALKEEAQRIFQGRPQDERQSLQQLNAEFTAAKSSNNIGGLDDSMRTTTSHRSDWSKDYFSSSNRSSASNRSTRSERMRLFIGA